MDVITIEFWNNIQAIVGILLTGVVTTAIVYFGAQGRSYIKDKQVQQIIKNVVLYVEQVYNSEDSQEKKRIAIEEAQKYLDGIGVKLDVEEVSLLIETVVFSELNRWKFEELIAEIEPA